MFLKVCRRNTRGALNQRYPFMMLVIFRNTIFNLYINNFHTKSAWMHMVFCKEFPEEIFNSLVLSKSLITVSW